MNTSADVVSTSKSSKVEAAVDTVLESKSLNTEVSADFGSLKDYFKTLSFDSLHIYYDHKERDSTLLGKTIPQVFLSYFPEEVRLGATEWNVDQVYGVYKFAYSPDITAMIARVPSEHSSTAYSIFLYNNSNGKLLHSQRIAIFEGSGGDMIKENSWLLDLNRDGMIDIVTKKRDTYSLDEELTKFTHYDSSFVFLGTPTGFKKSQEFHKQVKNFKLKEIK